MFSRKNRKQKRNKGSRAKPHGNTSQTPKPNSTKKQKQTQKQKQTKKITKPQTKKDAGEVLVPAI